MSSNENNLSIENFVTCSLLFELEKLLKDARYSLSHFNLPIPNHIGTASTKNRLILDELTYDSHTLATSMENDVSRLNTIQKFVLMKSTTLYSIMRVKHFLFMVMEGW
jgi:hypothetical protein